MQHNKNSSIDIRSLTLVAIAGAWLAGILLAANFQLPPLALLMCADIVGVLLILFYQDKGWRITLFFFLCLLLGAWRYTIAQPQNDPQSIVAYVGGATLDVQGTVADEPTIATRTRLFVVAVSTISKDDGSHWQAADGQVEIQTLSTTMEDPYGANYGDTVELQGKLVAPLPSTPPGIFASMTFPRVTVESSGGNSLLAFLYHLRATLATVIEQALPQPEAATLIGITLGLHTPDLTPISQAFTETGTVHLIVSSGFKVTLLAGIIGACTRWLYDYDSRSRLQLPAERRRDWRRWLSTALVIASIVIYTILSGAGPAALRAGIMGCIMVIAPRLNRTYNVYTALAFASLLMTIFDPFLPWNVSFQLSFLGTLGIVLLTPLFQHLLYPIERLPVGSLIVEIAAVTLAAQVATWPVVAIAFHNISFIAPLTNVLTVPLLGLLVLLGVAISIVGLLFPPLALVCAWVAQPILWYVDYVVTWCSQVYYAYVKVNTGPVNELVAFIYYRLLTTLIILLRLKWPSLFTSSQKLTNPLTLSRKTWHLIQLGAALLIIAITGLAAISPQQNGALTVTFFAAPTGQPPQGEAILIRTPDGKTALIDGGLDAALLAQELDSRLPPWQRSLDAVILTTPRSDHITGLQDVIMRYAIGEVIDAGMLHPTTTYARWRRTISERNLRYVLARQGTSIPLGTQVALQVLWPGPQLHAGSNEVRDNGLILRLVAPGLRMLLLGASAQSSYALGELVNAFTPDFLQAEIVQVMGDTHTAAPPELMDVLQKVHPSLLIVAPATLSPAQRKAGVSSIAETPLFSTSEVSIRQIVQIDQTGTRDITSTSAGWRMNIS